jgi:AMP phosphorylase
MKFKTKKLSISTGGPLVVLVYESDATTLGIINGDRVKINDYTAIINTTDKLDVIKKGEVGLFYEMSKKGIKNNILVDIIPANKPHSVEYIVKKLNGKRLNDVEIFEIIKDIVNGQLSQIEITYFVSASYFHGLNFKEIVSLTNAMIKTGDQLNFGNEIIADKHCIGGVAGNRTTVFVVPILAAAGVKIPKTSSRSITSPAGTADTMEVLTDVSLSVEKIKSVVNKVGGCLVWGGALSLAPADDIIIKVERPVSLDPTGQLLASILSKKKSMGATHCLIDIPVGRGSKILNKKKAIILKKNFLNLAKEINLKLKVVITDGSEPIGNGIGPALEARDIFWTLRNDERRSEHLLHKGVYLAGQLLELTGKCTKGKGEVLAKELIENGKAYNKFIEIIKAQGAKITSPEKIKLGKFTQKIKSLVKGKITYIDNKTISRIAKLAGAPSDKLAGLYLHKHKFDKVEIGDDLYTIYASSKTALNDAVKYCKSNLGFEFK